MKQQKPKIPANWIARKDLPQQQIDAVLEWVDCGANQHPAAQAYWACISCEFATDPYKWLAALLHPMDNAKGTSEIWAEADIFEFSFFNLRNLLARQCLAVMREQGGFIPGDKKPAA